jgi:hypothetical protein
MFATSVYVHKRCGTALALVARVAFSSKICLIRFSGSFKAALSVESAFEQVYRLASTVRHVRGGELPCLYRFSQIPWPFEPLQHS